MVVILGELYNAKKLETMAMMLSCVAVCYGVFFQMERKWNIFILGNKKGLKLSHKSLKYMVGPVGLEPTTCRL